MACYLRLVNSIGDVEVSLVMAKSLMSHLKPTTVPRLELTAKTAFSKDCCHALGVVENAKFEGG